MVSCFTANSLGIMLPKDVTSPLVVTKVTSVPGALLTPLLLSKLPDRSCSSEKTRIVLRRCQIETGGFRRASQSLTKMK